MTEKTLIDRVSRAKWEIQAAEKAEKAAKTRQENWRLHLADYESALKEYRQSQGQ